MLLIDSVDLRASDSGMGERFEPTLRSSEWCDIRYGAGSNGFDARKMEERVSIVSMVFDEVACC